MKTVIFFCLGLGYVTLPSLSAQLASPPRIEWQQTIGGTASDVPYAFVETADGGFVFGGTSLSGISGNKSSPSWDDNAMFGGDFWLIKLDSHGQKLWDRSYGGNDWDDLYELQQAPDGGFILGGKSLLSSGGNKSTLSYGSEDMWLVRVDSNGSKLWDQTLGGASYDFFRSIAQTVEGGILVAGSSSSAPSGNKSSDFFGPATDPFSFDGWVVMLDAVGNKLWDQSFGGFSTEQFSIARRTVDGGFILSGESASYFGGNKTSPYYGGTDVWLVRLDANGTKMWEQTYGGTDYEAIIDLVETADGGFMLGCSSGSTASGNKTSPLLDEFTGDPFSAYSDFWILRVDAQGTKLWDRSYGTKKVDWLLGFQPTAGGGAILRGISFLDDGFPQPNSPHEFRLLSISAAGDELWHQSFGTNTVFTQIVEMSDGGVLVGGWSSSGTNRIKTASNFGSNDCWLLRLDATGNRRWDLSLGGSGDDSLQTIARTKDGGFILGIASNSGADDNKATPGYGDYDMWIVKLSPESTPDSDGDGVPDAEDNCPNTPRGAIVNASGCTIDQLIPCDGPWKNHGQYVKTVVKVTGQFRKAGLISQKQRLAIFLRAVKSDCGRKHWQKRASAHYEKR